MTTPLAEFEREAKAVVKDVVDDSVMLWTPKMEAKAIKTLSQAAIRYGERMVVAARIDELERAKRQGYIAGNLVHKVDNRLAALRAGKS